MECACGHLSESVDAYVDHVEASRAQLRNRWEIYDPNATHYTQDPGAARSIAKAVGWQEVRPGHHVRRRRRGAVIRMAVGFLDT